jgi:hypothetical protein
MLRRCSLPWCCAAFTVTALAVLGVPQSARAEVLYTLETRCSLRGAVPVPCKVEAVNEGNATLYRHAIGQRNTTVRISDTPLRMELWDGAGGQWNSLRTAAARFSSNTVCFNGSDLCVVNPNYLNSVLQQNPAAMAGRDLVKVHFGADGRINASCYDDGCALKLQ